MKYIVGFADYSKGKFGFTKSMDYLSANEYKKEIEKNGGFAKIYDDWVPKERKVFNKRKAVKKK
jgi:hypothetical protein